jgi:hypothetical protein
VTWLVGNSYQLEATPLVDLEEQLWLGDVVYLEQGDDGALQFRGVASKSRWRHVDWIVGTNFRVRDPNDMRQVLGETAAFTAFKKSIEAAGGKWEQALGGVFLIVSSCSGGIDLLIQRPPSCWGARPSESIGNSYWLQLRGLAGMPAGESEQVTNSLPRQDRPLYAIAAKNDRFLTD